MQETFGYASGILAILSSIPYVRDIILLKTKPERASWFIWSVLLSIAFFAQLSEGGTWSLLLTAGDLIAVLIIFILSIKYGVGGKTKLDIWALVSAGIGLILWHITNEALFAIIITIFIDFLGGLPTIVKTYKDPYSETFLAWMMCGTAGLLGAISVWENNFSLLIFPIWICLINFAVAITIILGKRKLKRLAQ